MKRSLLLIPALLYCTMLRPQSFYDPAIIQSIEITFLQSNWDSLLDAEKAGNDGYVMARYVSINGTVFDSVGVKYKGNSSYNPNQVKNPFHIELDTYKSHIYQGYSDIKLSNGFKDPSFLREVLSYQILRQYMDAPQSNYAMVYVNGDLIGLYSNSESIGRKFLSKNFGSKENTFIKCNPPDGAGPGTNSKPNLMYLGQDSSLYYSAYEMESDYGWKDLIDLTDTLSHQLSSIEAILDVDRALWMLAFNNVLVNLDSYSGIFSQNYYLYRDDHDRFLTVIWDLNESFGQFSETGTGLLTTTSQKQQMSHLLHINDAAFPLIRQLLSIPMYKRMYLAHMKTIITENFSNGQYIGQAQALQATIDTAVQADFNKFYSYSNFLTNLTNDISSGGPPGPGNWTSPGIINLMNGRSTYLLSLTDFTAAAPEIASVTLSDSTPAIGQSIWLTAEITGATTVYLYHRNEVHAPFTPMLMLDDGLHHDGQAGDGIFGAQLSMQKTLLHYYIYAENNLAGRFSPVRAAHEYYTVSVNQDLVINEFMADNDHVIADPYGQFNDWIEIYNNSSDSIWLGDYYLTDDAASPLQWRLPEEYILPGGFRLFWASGDTSLGSDYAGFKLSKDGEEIGLFHYTSGPPDTADFIAFGAQVTDVSYGREYDASPNWVFFSSSTPNASNQSSTGLEKLPMDDPAVKVRPNPYIGWTLLENTDNESHKVLIFNGMGQLLDVLNLEPGATMTWHDQYRPGLRLFRSSDDSFAIKALAK